MRISTRLRKGRDDDIIDWYERQRRKSEAVREAIRTYIRLQKDDATTAPDEREKHRGLAWLPEAVAAAVREVLRTTPVRPTAPVEGEDMVEDEEAEDTFAAAQIDAQLDEWF